MNTNRTLRIGIHASIAGGLSNAVGSAVETGSDCFQIFARNPRCWYARPLECDAVREFRRARDKAGLWPLAVHSVYLINLAAPDAVQLARSREAFRQEIKRSLYLGAEYLVVHPGSAGGVAADVAIATAIESVLESTRGLKLRGAPASASQAGRNNALTILIENTAGQGSTIGCNFEQIARILSGLNELPVDVCLDTAHTFASGYDISTATGLRSTMRSIDRSFGFDRIKLIHCNDSKASLNARVDRHQHIGLGHIGADAFRRLTHSLKLSRVPFILETPVDSERGYEWNVDTLRELSNDPG